jgi:hypothetical protein
MTTNLETLYEVAEQVANGSLEHQRGRDVGDARLIAAGVLTEALRSQNLPATMKSIHSLQLGETTGIPEKQILALLDGSYQGAISLTNLTQIVSAIGCELTAGVVAQANGADYLRYQVHA